MNNLVEQPSAAALASVLATCAAHVDRYVEQTMAEHATTGIAGYTLTGGVGLLQRKWGPACDNLRAWRKFTAEAPVEVPSHVERPP